MMFGIEQHLLPKNREKSVMFQKIFHNAPFLPGKKLPFFKKLLFIPKLKVALAPIWSQKYLLAAAASLGGMDAQNRRVNYQKLF